MWNSRRQWKFCGEFGGLCCSEIDVAGQIEEVVHRDSSSRKCGEKLLLILNEEGLDVPLRIESLLGKKAQVLVRDVCPWSYCHIGIETKQKKFEHVLQNYDEVVLDINIDGIPLFKSSRVQLWPILCKIVNIKEKTQPFAVGIYLGTTKPSCIKDYLKDFIKGNCVKWKNNEIKVSLLNVRYSSKSFHLWRSWA